MTDILDFKPEHMIGIEKDDPDTNILLFCGDLDKKAEYYAKAGPAITLMDEDKLLALGGVIKFWPGVGEAWMLVSPDGRNKWISVYRYMSAFLMSCFVKHGFHRIQASILDSNMIAHKCAFKLGFIPEGMMVHYGPRKENFVRYVRFS